MSTSTLSKQYEPSEVEARWIRFWIENGYFHADETNPKVPFAITLPPPNVTGELHMGHALNGSIQDVLIRWHRLLGFDTLWQPGYDHAGISTQNVVEKQLLSGGDVA